MKDLYWIVVLGNFSGLMIVFSVILGIACVALGAVWYGFWWDIKEKLDYPFLKESTSLEELRTEHKRVTKWFMRTCIVFTITLLLAVFTPNKKELYFIYGVGSTIDYLKSNDTAKQLPDKAIKALDKWLDTNEHSNKKAN